MATKAELTTEITKKLKKDKEWLHRQIEDALYREWTPGTALQIDLESSKGNYPVRKSVLQEVTTDLERDGWKVSMSHTVADMYIIHVYLD